MTGASASTSSDLTSAEPPGAPPDGAPGDPVRLVAGRVARAHGLRGDVAVEIRSDQVDRRFAAGSVLATNPDRGPLTIESSRRHHDRLIVRFSGVDDRDGAEALRGTELLVDVSGELGATDGAVVGAPRDAADGNSWFVLELVGCDVVDPQGIGLGTVRAVMPSPAHDLLLVDHAGVEVLVPFVREIVPDVDVVARRVVVDAPAGLFDR